MSQIEHFPSNSETYQDNKQEIGAAQAEVAQAAMPALPTPVLTASQQGPVVASDDTPIVANDDDLIEKEWVDKAKKILAETREDPYKREQEISKLQIEYIRRRYGRQIGETGD
jgi:Txe/YoeB family toxin of Txe-Axe toxin-antitoxin module